MYRQQRTNPMKERRVSEEIIRSIRENKLQQPNAPELKPDIIVNKSFNDFEITDALKRNITAKQYITPTPIQDGAIPHILKGEDIIGIANTGTGKTAAFLIPLVDKVIRNPHERIIIVAPTRELALQIDEELMSFKKGLGIYSALCIGGTNMHRQRNDVRKNPHFVVGTPGRLKDFIRQRILDLSKFHTVVLDEADRMIDIGFIADIQYFISLLPKQRQSLFFSATIERKEREVLKQFVTNPITISVKKQDTAKNVTQGMIKVINRHQKVDQLHDLLIKKGFSKVLIFGKTKWGIQKLTDELIKRGFKANSIHGNKRQNQRQRILDDFKSNQFNILLATDVASRGLDINDVSHVINYEIPSTYEDYVHRIGRTGRANNKGEALTFID